MSGSCQCRVAVSVEQLSVSSSCQCRAAVSVEQLSQLLTILYANSRTAVLHWDSCPTIRQPVSGAHALSSVRCNHASSNVRGTSQRGSGKSRPKRKRIAIAILFPIWAKKRRAANRRTFLEIPRHFGNDRIAKGHGRVSQKLSLLSCRSQVEEVLRSFPRSIFD